MQAAYGGAGSFVFVCCFLPTTYIAYIVSTDLLFRSGYAAHESELLCGYRGVFAVEDTDRVGVTDSRSKN